MVGSAFTPPGRTAVEPAGGAWPAAGADSGMPSRAAVRRASVMRSLRTPAVRGGSDAEQPFAEPPCELDDPFSRLAIDLGRAAPRVGDLRQERLDASRPAHLAGQLDNASP